MCQFDEHAPASFTTSENVLIPWPGSGSWTVVLVGLGGRLPRMVRIAAGGMVFAGKDISP